jgi:hypothetical protein
LYGVIDSDPVTEETTEQREVRERVQTQYLPAWCAAQRAPVNSATFEPDWSFLTHGLAGWFLRAIDERVVAIENGWPMLPDSRRTYLFESDRGGSRIYREGFLEVAAAGMLVLRFGWARQRLTFQSPRLRSARVWAFDLLAYAAYDRQVVIAGEAKWRQRDAIDLVGALSSCGERGIHDEEGCRQRRSDHRKYVGLVEFRPHVLWIVGPDAFSGDPDLVFSVDVQGDGIVRLIRAKSSWLAAP